MARMQRSSILRGVVLSFACFSGCASNTQNGTFRRHVAKAVTRPLAQSIALSSARSFVNSAAQSSADHWRD